MNNLKLLWRQGLLLLALMGIFLPCAVWAWDGNWTDAESSYVNDDPDNTQNQTGTDPPQKFWKAGPRDFVEVDPEELADYFKRRNKAYAPYALLRVTQQLRYAQSVIPKGYYLLKIGDLADGSTNVHLAQASDPNSFPVQTSGKSSTTQSKTQPVQNTKMKDPKTGIVIPYRAFTVIQQGKVIAVLPIHRMRAYKPPRKEKIPKRPLAWVDWEDQHPVLRYFEHHWIFETELN